MGLNSSENIAYNDVSGNFSLTLIDALDTLVVLNDRAGFEGVSGTIVIGTQRHRDGRPVDGPLALEPSEGVLVRLG